MLRLQTAKLPATVLAFLSRLRYANFALSAKVCCLRNSKAVLQEWDNAAVRQALPFCGVDRQAEARFHLVLLQWV